MLTAVTERMSVIAFTKYASVVDNMSNRIQMRKNLFWNLQKLQLNEYEADRYFLQNFQWSIVLIYLFCKICETEPERDFSFVSKI